jgi:hypothetical protein
MWDLRLSDAQIAENKRRQDDLRRKFNSRTKLSPADNERARAIVLEDSLRDNLKLVHGNSKKSVVLEKQLAESLASQGKFKEAAEYSTGKEKEFYLKVDSAVWADDDLCECEAPKEAVAGKLLELPKHRLIKQVYSLKHGVVMNLLECQTCGEWNVRDLTDDLRKLQQAAEVNRLADKNGQKRIDDIELLKSDL